MGSRMEKEREEKEEDSKISRGSSWLEGISSGIRLAGGPRGPPIVGYTRARVSPRATFPGNGRVIPRVTQVPSATEGEIAQRKNFGADLRLSLGPLLPASIHPSISWSDDSCVPSKTGNVILVAVGKKEEGRRKEGGVLRRWWNGGISLCFLRHGRKIFLFLWKRLNGKRNIRFRKEND